MLTPVAIARSGFIASGAVGWPHLASGAARSGHVADAALVSGGYASGSIASGHLASGTLATGSGFIGSGSVGGFYGVVRHVQSGTVGSFDLASGAVEAGAVGSGAVQSGNIASGQVGLNHLASGAVRSGHVASGQLGYRHYSSGSVGVNAVGSGAVLSGNIAPNTINLYHFSSGELSFGAGRIQPYDTRRFAGGGLPAGELISGFRAVCIVSGKCMIAKPGLSGYMPAVGVTVSNFVADSFVDVIAYGNAEATSGLSFFSGRLGEPLYVGRSGHIAPVSGSWNSGGFLSGDVIQQIGIAYANGVNAEPVMTVTAFAPHVSGGPHVTTSGAVLAGSMGSGSVVSGNIASGQVGHNHLSSGGVLSGAVASGQIGGNHHASGGVTSGAVASGQIGRNHLGSGILADVRNLNDFRLTLASGNAYPSTDVSGVAVHLVPVSADGTLSGAVGFISFYDTTVSGWVPLRTSGTIGPTVSGSSGAVYDVLAFNNAGTLSLELSAPWTNLTTRADLLKLQDGVPVKSGDVTRRWVGTIGVPSSGVLADSQLRRLVANAYNRRKTFLHTCPGYADGNTATSYTFLVATYGPIHSGFVDDRLHFVVPGVNQPYDTVKGEAWVQATAGTSQFRHGIGRDTTSNPRKEGRIQANAQDQNSVIEDAYESPGWHVWYFLGESDGGTATIIADDARAGGQSNDPERTYMDIEINL